MYHCIVSIQLRSVPHNAHHHLEALSACETEGKRAVLGEMTRRDLVHQLMKEERLKKEGEFRAIVRLLRQKKIFLLGKLFL